MEHEGTITTNKQGYDIETLRAILERQQNRPVPYEEALDIGTSLVNFFELLATDQDEYSEGIDQ